MRLPKLIILLCSPIALVSCQAAQSPAIPTQKNIYIEIHGTNNSIIVNYDQETQVEVGGGNTADQKQDNKLSIPIP